MLFAASFAPFCHTKRPCGVVPATCDVVPGICDVVPALNRPGSSGCGGALRRSKSRLGGSVALASVDYDGREERKDGSLAFDALLHERELVHAPEGGRLGDDEVAVLINRTTVGGNW